MKNRFFLSAVLLMFYQINVIAQITTEKPFVENYSQSNIADVPIIGVSIDEDVTLVVFEHITNRNLTDGWISLSSKTTLKGKNTNVSLKIKDWGVFDSEANSLDFDEKYSVKADRKYTFYMIFPSLPNGIENISIQENIGSSEFYWNGIHINNPKNISENNNATYPREQPKDDFQITGSGSGFAITSYGLIATSYHVVEDATKIQIRGVNGDFDNAFKAKIISFDKNNDLAILKIDDSKFHEINEIPYSISNRIAEVGENIFVLGYPLRAIMGDEIKLTNGLISSKSGFQGDVTSYQISAAVQAGNSGCPLFNEAGNVIGIINARLFVESAAYAVKTPYLKILLSSIENPPILSENNSLSGKTLSEKVKEIKKYVYIIETE